MSDFDLKIEDSLPVFRITLDEDIRGNTEVRFYVQEASSGTLVVNDTMTVNDDAVGDVQYDFSAAQTAREGFHLAEVVVTYSGDDESFPKDGFYTFEFNETLNRDAGVEAATAGATVQSLVTKGDIEDDAGNLIYDYSGVHIEQSILENDSVTVAGNTVSLGGSTTVAHADLTGISVDDHHTRYVDEEAQDAVGTILGTNFTYDDATPSISLTDDSITVTAGNALGGGGSVALGGSTTLNVLTDGIGTNEIDLAIAPTWTSEHTFSAGLQSNDDVSLDGSNSTFIHDRQDVSTNITTDGSGYYSVDSSGGARTITLATADATDGKEINIKRNGANNVTVDTEGTQTIDGATSYVLDADDASITVVYNGTTSEWEVF